MLKKKIWASFQRIIELFTQKFVTKLRIHGSKRHRIPDPDLQHWQRYREIAPLFSVSNSKQEFKALPIHYQGWCEG